MTPITTPINLGTAPAGTDGDPVRTASQKTNDNFAALVAAFAGIPGTFGTLPDAAASVVGSLDSAPGGWSAYSNTSTNTPGNYGLVYTFGTNGTNVAAANGVFVYQIAYDTSGQMLMRQNINADGWSAWVSFVTGAGAAATYFAKAGGVISGDTQIGDGTTQPTLSLNGNGGTAHLTYKNAGAELWDWLTYGAISSSDDGTGGHLYLTRYVGGAASNNPVRIDRKTGQVSFAVRPSWGDTTPGQTGTKITPWDSGNLVAPVDTGTAATTKAGRSALGMGSVLVARTVIPVGSEVGVVNFPSFVSSEFDSYEMVMDDMTCDGTSGGLIQFLLQFTHDNGATYRSAADYLAQNTYVLYTGTASTSNGTSGDTKIYLGVTVAGNWSSYSKFTMHGKYEIMPTTKGVVGVTGNLTGVTLGANSSPAALVQQIWGHYTAATLGSATPITGFRIFVNAAGNGSSTKYAGTISIYGRRNGT